MIRVDLGVVSFTIHTKDVAKAIECAKNIYYQYYSIKNPAVTGYEVIC